MALKAKINHRRIYMHCMNRPYIWKNGGTLGHAESLERLNRQMSLIQGISSDLRICLRRLYSVEDREEPLDSIALFL
jgi:hypothetical protein